MNYFNLAKVTNGRSSSPSILSRGPEPTYRANDLVNDAYGIKLTPAQLQKYGADYAEVSRAEMLRVSELENLKSGNASLAVQVKRLEQSLAELNREHIELANAMVQGKMENAKLADENEELREEVVQLKQVIDGQPAEVEAKLKDEMERIMERNLEVMSMNRELEEQVSELEKQLVETKLQFAQVCVLLPIPLRKLMFNKVHQNHEALTRKWNELRKALD
jgi:ecotropic viral integration site 5 protein